jgi:hypothetical protein
MLQIVRAIGLTAIVLALVACRSVPPTTVQAPSATPTRTPAPPTAKPTKVPPTPTATLTPTALPMPPAGQVIKGGNLRSEPRVVPATIIGHICIHDSVAFVAQQTVGKALWYRIRVTERKADCTAKQVAIGTEGWVSSILLSEPSYPIEDYTRAANVTTPTATVPPTATPKPTAVP